MFFYLFLDKLRTSQKRMIYIIDKANFISDSRSDCQKKLLVVKSKGYNKLISKIKG